VKELKQISTGLATMSAMLVGHHAAQRVPDHPYLARQMSRGETWTDPQGDNPSGCRLIVGVRDLRV
jgi:hypothetical protein